uniref:RAG1 importin-binding domain-containing protein n=1 Tax=Clytia hemisphaerica TaxID=252671 RepID=A0A7M5XJU9_9CNID
MEGHSRKISKVCRLCRKKINTNASYTESNVKTCVQLKDKILMLFSHDVSDDNPLQHPTKLCHNCSVKLNKVECDGQYLSSTIAEFEEHDDSCTLCRLHRLKEHKFPMKQSKVFDLDTLVAIAKENGFILLELLSKKNSKNCFVEQGQCYNTFVYCKI